MSAFASQPCGDCNYDKNGNYVCNGTKTGDGDHFIIIDVSIIQRVDFKLSTFALI